MQTAEKSPPDQKVPTKFSVFVSYNGVERAVPVETHEAVQALLSRSIQVLSVGTQPHLLSLFNAAGVELPDAAKVGEIGIRPDDHLLLRPGAVKGGAWSRALRPST